MPKAHEVATELRKLADSLDKNPEASIQAPMVAFYHHLKSEKDAFLSVCRILPRPLVKSLAQYGSGDPDIQIKYVTDAISIKASIPQSLTCTMVEPAKPAVYHCDPILSAEEDATLIEA